MNRVQVLAIALALASGCYDPVHQDSVAALGPEPTSEAPSALHRPGQPCLTCHGGSGPADLELSVGGTMFAVRGGTLPLADVTITLTDATGDARSATSNTTGNFFFRKDQWSPVFPLHSAIAVDDIHRGMTTMIGRDGSCATCHRGAGDANHMPGIFARDK